MVEAIVGRRAGLADLRDEHATPCKFRPSGR